MLSLEADDMGTMMLQLLTSIIVFIAALHVMHACTGVQPIYKATGELELRCNINDANWYKDGVLLHTSSEAGIIVSGNTVSISPVPIHEGIYFCNSSTEMEIECFSVQGILA